MKSITSILFGSVICLLSACGQVHSEEYSDNESFYIEYGKGGNNSNYGKAALASNNIANAKPNVKRPPIEMKPMRDPRTGRITSYLPLPADWKMVTLPSGGKGFEGPNGIKVHFMPSENYYYNIDPYMAQMAGKAVSNPIPLETIFLNNIAPNIQQQGGKLIKQYALPEISQRNKQLLQQSLSRSRVLSCTMHASEWQQPNGMKSLILVGQGIIESQGGNAWWITLTEIEAPSQMFAEAKETYLFAEANWQPDQQSAMAHASDLNRMERESQQMLASSTARHNAKMRQNEAAFQAQQKSHVSTYNNMSENSMKGYWSRGESQERLRNQEVNSIHEENTVSNPWGGESLQVRSGYNAYYMNHQGDIIGSNNANFNPNIESGYNNTEWRKMPNR